MHNRLQSEAWLPAIHRLTEMIRMIQVNSVSDEMLILRCDL